MCLIIQREPNFEIPFEKFKTAILNNPHGYGLSFPDDKGLSVIRTPEEPDPEALYRLVNEELFDKKLLIHLRYTTHGATNMRNAHPFPVLERKTDGVDLRMAHNGTLSSWKTRAEGTESDTRAFVKGFVRPLFKRLSKGMDVHEILNDDFTKALLEGQLSYASVLTFIDGEGNSLLCNPTGNGGKVDEGWYYSNTYSFDPEHRKPKNPTSGATRHGKTGGTTTTSHSSGTPTTYTTAKTVTRFTDRYGLKSINDVHALTDDTLDKLVQDKQTSLLLIKELILEHYVTQQSNQKLLTENRALKQKLN